ncbi:MAG: sensor histidine kinase, partial [Actinomycetota bacterium]
TVELDPVRVRQIVTNLVGNAVKFSPQGSRIDVTVRRSGDGASITVRDRGPGIPAARRDELFRKFSRLGAKGGGTGLGLYLSRGIALAHGGNLTVETRPGEGSAFTLILPGTPMGAGRAPR